MRLSFVILVISFIFILSTEAEDYNQGYWSQFMQPQQQMNPEWNQYRRYYQYDPSMYNNWYQMMPREPVNPEAFNYFGNLRNSYGEPLVSDNYPQQETQRYEEPDMMSAMFSGMKTQRDVNHPEKSQESMNWNEEDEEMIDLPPVDEEDMGIIGDILAKIAQTISEGGLIKDKEEGHKPPHHHSSETVKKEINQRQSHSMDSGERRSDDCIFEMTDFLFPERSLTEKLRRCQEQQELERMNGPANAEKASEEEVVAIMDLEKHFVNGEECICVMDFQCENDKIITDGRTIIDTRIHQNDYEDMMRSRRGICASPMEVCCKLENGHHQPHSEAHENHERPHHTEKDSDNLIPVSHKPEGRAEKPCKCVPFYQCSLENTLIKYGEGILEERFGLNDENETMYPQCEGVLDVCCAEY